MMKYNVYIIKNGALQKLGEIDAAMFAGDLIKAGAKWYRVLYRAFEAKADSNEMNYIVEEYNPLNP